MTKSDLEELLREVRGLAPSEELDPEEYWDSLDHLELISRLRRPPYSVDNSVDLSEANCLTKLSAAVCR